MLDLVEPILAPSEQLRDLYRLSDPTLSELDLEQLLDELLVRVRDILDVDTAAILLIDEATEELVARAAKGIEEEVEQGVRIPLGTGFAGRIAAERAAIFIADVDHADIMNPILREKGIQSLLGVPLIVEGELIGVLHVGSLRPREFGQRELAVLQLASARIAPGIERARLFSALEHEHQVAVLLQHSLLPGRLPETLGVNVAARYLPARDEVGGDWYDVIELPDWKLGVAIGDVVGHGIRAAALMGRLRTALHAYALEGHGPGRTLELVDRFIQSINEYSMATAAYVVFDPESGQMQWATAGHLPPVVVSGGRAQGLEVTPGPPLGAFPYGTYPEHELTLTSGEMLMLYTDGLVERRGVPLARGIEKLLGAIATATSADELCGLAVDALVPEAGLADDAAMVVMHSIALPAELHLEPSADPHVLARIRHILRRWLREHGADEQAITEITLAVNEACANAIEHAYPPTAAAFELGASVTGDVVEIVVRDGGRWRPPRAAERGRGLTMIEAAVDKFEVRTGEHGTELVISHRIRSR